MTAAAIATLSSLRLPETGDLRRQMPGTPQSLGQAYVDSFDALTLVYDCFYDDAAAEVVLVCPRLLNLWPVLRDGLRLDGRPVAGALRRSRQLRVEILRIPAPARPDRIEVSIGSMRHSVPVLSQDLGAFAGLNVMIAISKNNRIEWIDDWLRYHIRAHGAQALVLFDNGSTDYPVEELRARLERIDGLKACLIVPCDFPYGGPSGSRFVPPAKFLQTSMFNLARLRYLARARAVLSVDIDELVWPENGSVFDAAARSRLGLITFFGRWVYPTEAGQAQPQRAHAMQRTSRSRIRNPKWCLVPDSLAGRFGWAVHRPGGALYPFSMRWRHGYWHCYATSTSWKSNRLRSRPDLVPCPELTGAIARYLGDGG